MIVKITPVSMGVSVMMDLIDTSVTVRQVELGNIAPGYRPALTVYNIKHIYMLNCELIS
jgi:hypothetical protein